MKKITKKFVDEIQAIMDELGCSVDSALNILDSVVEYTPDLFEDEGQDECTCKCGECTCEEEDEDALDEVEDFTLTVSTNGRIAIPHRYLDQIMTDAQASILWDSDNAVLVIGDEYAVNQYADDNDISMPEICTRGYAPNGQLQFTLNKYVEGYERGEEVDAVINYTKSHIEITL